MRSWTADDRARHTSTMPPPFVYSGAVLCSAIDHASYRSTSQPASQRVKYKHMRLDNSYR